MSVLDRSFLLGIIFALLVILLAILLTGCSHNYLDVWEYEDGEVVKRIKATQAQFLFWSEFKNLEYVEPNEIEYRIGGYAGGPDANSIKAAGGLAGEVVKGACL